MCCAFLLLGFLGPRLAFLWVWIFNLRPVQEAMGGNFVVPLLGVIFLPWTSLMWVLCWSPIAGVSGFGYLLVILGLFLDLATWSGRFAQNRYQAQGGQVTG